MTIPAGDWGTQFRWSFTDPVCQKALKRQQPVMADLKIVYDNDGLWDWGYPKEDGPEILSKMVDQYADAGAKAIVWGCGNNTAWSYTPKVQEAWCDRVPADNQELKKFTDVFRAWLNAGTDPLAVVLERANTRKLPVLAGFRLNRFMPKFGVESWFEKNPHVALSEASCPMYLSQIGANLALDEVKEHFVAGSIDVVERYEVDGLHLEFMRAIPFFERDEPNKTEHLIEFLRMLRKELDRIGEKRGKRMKLSIWIGTPEHYQLIRRNIFPPEFFDLSFHGIDPKTWINEKLVDILMVGVWSGGAGRRAKPVDIKPWMDMAQGSQTKVLGVIDNAAELQESEYLRESEEVIRSINSHSDGVFLFNTQPLHLALLLEGAARQ